MTIVDARTIVGQNLGFTNADGSAYDGSIASYANLSQGDQIKFNDALAAYIVQNSGDFDSQQVTLASQVVKNPSYNTPLADVSLQAQISDFGTQFANQIVLKTDLLGNTLKYALYIAVAVGVIFYLSPYVIKNWNK